MSFNQAKVFEAREHCKAAEKFLKTNMFRWKPDFDSSADEYSQAAQCYRIARDMANSKECHLKASDCYKKNHSYFHAAKALENAIIVSKETATPDEIFNLAMEAGSLFQQHGSGDSGASVLDKAAKILEGTSPELAVKLFQQAADVSSDHGIPSSRQVALLVSFVISNPWIDSLSPTNIRKLNALTSELNLIGGTEKTADEWIQYWLELKNNEPASSALAEVGSKNNEPASSALAEVGSKNNEPASSALAEVGLKNNEPASSALAEVGSKTVTESVAGPRGVKPGEFRSAPQPTAATSAPATAVAKTESSQHQGSEYISKASRILVKLQWYDQAVDSIRREIGFHQESGNVGAIGRLTVAIVLVQLARGDAVAAEKAYKEWGSNCEVAEMQTLEQILQAYDEEDRESAKRALASPFIRNMDVEYARLAASVPLPEAIEPAPRAAVRENAAPSYVSPNATSSTTAEISGTMEESPYATVTYAKKPKEDEEDGLC